MKKNKNRTRAEQIAADQSMIDGMTKHQATMGTLLIGTKPYTVAQAITIVQTCQIASKKVVTERATFEAVLAAETNARLQNKPFLTGLTQTVLAMFAGQSDQLADFALQARRTPTISPETKVAAAQKAAATRKARGTKGQKAKQAITGNVTGIVVTPVVAPQPTETPNPASIAPVAPTTPGGTSGNAPTHS